MNSTNTFLEARPRFAFPSARRRDTPPPGVFGQGVRNRLKRKRLSLRGAKEFARVGKERGIATCRASPREPPLSGVAGRSLWRSLRRVRLLHRVVFGSC